MSSAGSQAAEPDFATLLKQAGENYRTPEGHTYYDKFLPPVTEAIVKTLYNCDENGIPPGKTLDFVFLIAADGAVKRLLYPHGIPFGECIARQMKAIKSLPPPPHQDWAVVIHVGSTP
jgi:hypothetical protein